MVSCVVVHRLVGFVSMFMMYMLLTSEMMLLFMCIDVLVVMVCMLYRMILTFASMMTCLFVMRMVVVVGGVCVDMLCGDGD